MVEPLHQRRLNFVPGNRVSRSPSTSTLGRENWEEDGSAKELIALRRRVAQLESTCRQYHALVPRLRDLEQAALRLPAGARSTDSPKLKTAHENFDLRTKLAASREDADGLRAQVTALQQENAALRQAVQALSATPPPR